MIKLYAKIFGISDQDIAEAEWLKAWINRHHNNLKYNDIEFKFYWID